MKVYENVLELIGKTPMVKYNDNILLKLEFLNPSHSVKDRASFYMLNEAKKQGLIDKDTVVIEPTSGNTGIGLAMCCAVMGLKIIIVMPGKDAYPFIYSFLPHFTRHYLLLSSIFLSIC